MVVSRIEGVDSLEGKHSEGGRHISRVRTSLRVFLSYATGNAHPGGSPSSGIVMSETITKAEKNRRISSRRVAKTAARVECRKGALGLTKNIAAGFVDLSETGIQLVVCAPLGRGDEVEILLSAVGGRTVKILGQVVWAASGLVEGIHRIGVRFDKRVPYATLMDLTRLPETR